VALEENSRFFKARLSQPTEMVKMEHGKCEEPIAEQAELLKQLQESLNVERIKRCTAHECSKAIVEEGRKTLETTTQHIMGLVQLKRAERCHDADAYVDAQVKENNMGLSLGQDLDRGMRQRRKSLKSIRDDVEMKGKQILDAFAQEAAFSESSQLESTSCFGRFVQEDTRMQRQRPMI